MAMNDPKEQKPGPCPLGETLPLADGEPEQITDEEFAEQAALHQEFVAAVAGDEEFSRRTRASHEQALRREFVTGSAILSALKGKSGEKGK